MTNPGPDTAGEGDHNVGAGEESTSLPPTSRRGSERGESLTDGPGEDLGSWRKTEAESLKLVDFPVEHDSEIWSRDWMNGNLKICVLEVIENITSPFLIDPKIDAIVFIWNLVRVTYLFRLNRSITGRHPSLPFASRRACCKSPSQAGPPIPEVYKL